MHVPKTQRRKQNNETLNLMLAHLFPPLAVYRQNGIGSSFWLNLSLTLLGFFPGMLHAVFISLKSFRANRGVPVLDVVRRLEAKGVRPQI